MSQKNYIQGLSFTAFMQIVDKSLRYNFSKIEITRGEDRVLVDCFIDNEPSRKAATVCFDNFEVSVECDSDILYNKDMMNISYYEIMERIYGDEYKKDWDHFHFEREENENSQPKK